MNYSLVAESPETLLSSWNQLQHLRWNQIFSLPCWLKAWLKEFGDGFDLNLYSVRKGQDIMGIAPLLSKDRREYFIGTPDICDYMDFVIAPGNEHEFIDFLFENLSQKGMQVLELNCIRGDSSNLDVIVTSARNRGYKLSCHLEAVSLEIELPDTWEEYLLMLDSKQGREVRRKLRRLEEAGDLNYYVISEVNSSIATLELFLKLFRASREDKAAFMSPRMENFFRSMVDSMANAGLLRFGILELDTSPVAIVMYFDCFNKVYLYNSGYDPTYRDLSVGLVSKVLCIKDAIRNGKKTFDFMKGNEVYKYRLGGKEVPIFGCQILAQ